MQIFHFSHFCLNKVVVRKKLKLKSENNHSISNELKKIKEECENYRKKYDNDMENKNKELEIKNKELEQIKIELNNNKDNYEKRIEQ